MKSSLLIHVSLIAVFFGALVAGIPEDKKEITIDQLDGGKGAAKFLHEKHATQYKVDGKEISCKDCHHTSKTEEEAKSCSECHVAEGEAQKEFDGKKAPFFGKKVNDKYKTADILMHGLCLECHKKVKVDSEGKKITSCKQCHD
jgi:Zn finger protein HypA/HybF involved in hydrogenase expression